MAAKQNNGVDDNMRDIGSAAGPLCGTVILSTKAL